ncbi:hypothetical protein [Absidia glauca]|uniref:Uncharacterized protein n=1 Tax=Absidia glauca TaxID=4829 RepID=A0A168T1K1_ABSGL|nr:hypothetical protein [Absidia glauca]
MEVMSNETTATEPTFTPSLGLRYWMNKMKPAKDASSDQDQRASSLLNYYDAPSITSVSKEMASSSLRVLHHQNDTASDQSSFLSEDIQSTASIKSKPWISQAIHQQRRYSEDDDRTSGSSNPPQRQPHRRRWSENELFPLGRIKAGLGRLVLGREQSSPPTASH